LIQESRDDAHPAIALKGTLASFVKHGLVSMRQQTSILFVPINLLSFSCQALGVRVGASINIKNIPAHIQGILDIKHSDPQHQYYFLPELFSRNWRVDTITLIPYGQADQLRPFWFYW